MKIDATLIAYKLMTVTTFSWQPCDLHQIFFFLKHAPNVTKMK